MSPRDGTDMRSTLSALSWFRSPRKHLFSQPTFQYVYMNQRRHSWKTMDATPVTVDAIDLVLREARVCNAQLNCIQWMLHSDNNISNEEWLRSMEATTAMIFRDMVSYLYSVLDHLFYFLYCRFQNNGGVSFTNAAFDIKQPMKQSLKFSQYPNRDNAPECKKARNKWVEDRCKEIFGDQYQNIDLGKLRHFQDRLIAMQAIKEVDKSGKEVQSGNGVSKLFYAHEIRHPQQTGPDDRTFNPEIDFKELNSVKVLDEWNDAMTFNLLNFFRNFTTHRTLLECRMTSGYFNIYTSEFKPGDDEPADEGQKWNKVPKGFWIKVPELSYLRTDCTTTDVTFYWQPLLLVSSRLQGFVRTFRDDILGIVGDVQRYDMDDMRWPGSGATPEIALRKDGMVVGIYAWDSARLHAAD